MGGAILICCIAFANPPLAVVTVDRDNIEITQSCVIQIGSNPIIDADNNGVIHITRPGITVDLNNQHLHGANAGQSPDTFSGTGIKITATDVTLHNAIVSGYKVGIHAINAHGFHIHHCDVSNNFHQRLKSTPRAEDAGDWLWPHYNDNDEWITNYGAGLCVEDSKIVRIHDIRARKTQNGIILDRVNESKVYDCDCSFLSGWGLAMWRSNRNVISRNAFDFCVRGYSHGVYNRGQDSAGILMFEQCSGNFIIENSATHGGDGFFAFGGKEALGETNRRDDPEWYKSRGCNENMFLKNDFSYAVAHGLELTFSFKNIVLKNRFAGNAICGIWGGYSQDFWIADNDFESNGDMAYGLERGGINIEHGHRNAITLNRFVSNRCGIHLWWDNDEHFFASPWYQINAPHEHAASIAGNSFHRDALAIHVRDLKIPLKLALNEFREVQAERDISPDAAIENLGSIAPGDATDLKASTNIKLPFEIPGEKQPFGAHPALTGRMHIIMTEWGPYDWRSYLLHRIDDGESLQHEYRLLGPFPRIFRGLQAAMVKTTGDIDIEITDETKFVVRPRQSQSITPYSVSIRMTDDDDGVASRAGTLTRGTWEVWTFKSACDPREDAERWRREGQADHHTLTADRIDFRFGSGGMSEARGLPAVLPRDHFGIIATRTLTLPPGRWRLKTTSDDGIRVWMDDALVIDDWTWHPPKEHAFEFEVNEAREVNLRVEYFELDGYAILALDIELQ